MSYLVSSSAQQDKLQLFFSYFNVIFFPCNWKLTSQFCSLILLNILPTLMLCNVKYCRHVRLACKHYYKHTCPTLAAVWEHSTWMLENHTTWLFRLNTKIAHNLTCIYKYKVRNITLFWLLNQRQFVVLTAARSKLRTRAWTDDL